LEKKRGERRRIANDYGKGSARRLNQGTRKVLCRRRTNAIRSKKKNNTTVYRRASCRIAAKRQQHQRGRRSGTPISPSTSQEEIPLSSGLDPRKQAFGQLTSRALWEKRPDTEKSGHLTLEKRGRSKSRGPKRVPLRKIFDPRPRDDRVRDRKSFTWETGRRGLQEDAKKSAVRSSRII